MESSHRGFITPTDVTANGSVIYFDTDYSLAYVSSSLYINIHVGGIEMYNHSTILELLL